MNGGEALAQAALALVGTGFRLHGRDPATGLDCLGLAGAALSRCGLNVALPAAYRLRSDAASLLPAAGIAGLDEISSDAPYAAGDMLLVRSGPGQAHLVILVPGGFVHAHAGLRRVVLTPGKMSWPLLRGWRLPAKQG